MITVKEISKKEPLIIEGYVEMGDVYQNICCEGYGWEVVLIFEDNTNRRDDSVWGVCQNPNCPEVQPEFKDTPEQDMYRGMSNYLLDSFYERVSKL